MAYHSYDGLKVSPTGAITLQGQYWDGVDKRDWIEIEVDTPERLVDDLAEAINKRNQIVKDLAAQKINLLQQKKAQIEQELQALQRQIDVQSEVAIPEKPKKVK